MESPDEKAGASPRASDIEREAVVARLNRACGEGLLNLGEFSERVESARVVRTRAELDRLVDDVPDTSGTRAVRTQWHVAPVGGLRRHGRWRMDRHLVALTVIGGTSLDLRDAEITAPEVTLTKVSLLGNVTVCVPRGVRVVLEGRSLLPCPRGGRLDDCDDAGPDAPTLRIRSFSLLGGVTVQSPPYGP